MAGKMWLQLRYMYVCLFTVIIILSCARTGSGSSE